MHARWQIDPKPTESVRGAASAPMADKADEDPKMVQEYKQLMELNQQMKAQLMFMR